MVFSTVVYGDAIAGAIARAEVRQNFRSLQFTASLFVPIEIRLGGVVV